VKLACELPDKVDRSLSIWSCAELARTAIARGLVDAISPQTVQRILASHKLRPWRVHHWLSSKVAMDESFRQTVVNVSDLYSRPIVAHEQIWSLDEKTSLQPRTRSAPNLPPQPGGVPIHVGMHCTEHALPRRRLRAHSRSHERGSDKSEVGESGGRVAGERHERGGVRGGQGIRGFDAALVGGQAEAGVEGAAARCDGARRPDFAERARVGARFTCEGQRGRAVGHGGDRR
jgi:hypothetical protein